MVRAYYNLAKPGIVYGNLVTAVAGYLMASRLKLTIISFVSMFVGYALVIGSAGVFNNLYDKDIDTKMDRTKKRPSVTGEISLMNSVIYGLALLLIGLVVLALGTNLISLSIAMIGFIVYVSAYTYSKRKTHYSTLIGSISGATPIVGGYVAFSGHFTLIAGLLGLMMLLWQMPHFYAIAIYRYKDYRQAKIPTLPIVAGRKTTNYMMVFYTTLFIIASLALYHYAHLSLFYLVVVLASSLFWLGFNIRGLFIGSIKSWARKSFFMSLVVVVLMALMVALR